MKKNDVCVKTQYSYAQAIAVVCVLTSVIHSSRGTSQLATQVISCVGNEIASPGEDTRTVRSVRFVPPL